MDDTIAAISTAPGRAGLALVRVSGPDVTRVAGDVGLPDLEPRRVTYGEVRHPEDGRPLDRVLATRFVAPSSYTGEDVLEISCHGGELVPALILDAVVCAGARPAEPGEFARRAYLNGKLDLIQVEATLDLIDSRSEAHHRAALFQLDGALSHRIEALRQDLLRLQAALSYDIDFPEEDDGPVAPDQILSQARALSTALGELLRTAPEGELLREGALTVIAGRPNAGKSSIFNALLGQQRAIVTEHAGTTRDAIEAVVSLDGYPFRLVDTAGVREEAGEVEEIGIEVARRYLGHAAILLLCAEAGRAIERAESEIAERVRGRGAAVVWVRTKADLAPGWEAVPRRGPDLVPVDGDRAVLVSALTGSGLPELRAALREAAFGGLRSSPEPPLLTRRRQTRQVRHAREETERFVAALAEGAPPEVAATHLQRATGGLEELLGVVDVEDVLEVLFQSFCVGK